MASRIECGPARLLTCVAILSAGASGLRQTSAQTTLPRFQASLAGEERVFWIVVSEWTPHEKGYGNWLAYIDKSSAEVHGVAGPLLQPSRIVRVAAAGSDLHVFYEDGGHNSYAARAGFGEQAQRHEIRLPDAVIPEALAGDVADKDADLWAVVRAGTAHVIARRWQRTTELRATQPAAQTRPAPASAPASQPVMHEPTPGEYHLVRYTGADWRPEIALPQIPPRSERVWLAIDGGRYHFFWQLDKQDRQIFYAWSEKEQWTPGPSVELSLPPSEIVVGVGNRQLLLIAMLPDKGRTRFTPRAYVRAARSIGPEVPEWRETPPLRSSDSKPLSLPPGSAAAPFGDLIGIVRTAGDAPELGFWAITGGQPDQDFRPVKLRRSLVNPQQRTTRELTTAIALAGLLLLVFWRRQATFAAPLTLPSDVMLAGVGRRGAAALVDILPAALITIAWWSDDIHTATELMSSGGDTNQIAELFFVPSLVFRVIYIVYCIAFELMWARTPGKWLTGCVVISETLTPPTWGQVVARNITRLIELSQYLAISLPLLLLVLLTRNRQRVGDLLARTLVVQPGLRLDDSENQRPE